MDVSRDKVVDEENSSVPTSEQLLRQSLNRFDDKLLETILSYLTFSEKVLFESVSKRWQQLVYRQQKQLFFTQFDWEPTNSLNKLLEPIEVTDYSRGMARNRYDYKQINKLSFQTLLRKCQELEEVVFECFVDLEDLDLVCSNCPKLKSLNFLTMGLSCDDLVYIGNRYGHKLENLNINHSINDSLSDFSKTYLNKFLIHCKNLKQINAQYLNEMFIEDKDYLPNIQDITQYSINFDDQDKTFFEKFCQKVGPTLKKICMYVYGQLKPDIFDSFFTSVCKLNQMTSLSFFLEEHLEDGPGLYKYLLEMTKSMPNLKMFEISFNAVKDLTTDQLFCALKGFTNLVSLEVWISHYIDNTSSDERVKYFESFKELKYLLLSIEYINEEVFDEIHNYLPNLTQIHIRCENELTDKTLLQFSHLKKLKNFNYCKKVEDNSKNITDESVCALINGCPALEKLTFGSRPNITEKTIETLISCANNYPKRRLQFNCYYSEEEHSTHIPDIDMNRFNDKIPENLTINYWIQ